ncbi:MAG: hypothetical protein NC177_06595 [Ruminococcus flavefaciens]|nr:hypothetical protein [Ruminococcus flavefaciens]
MEYEKTGENFSFGVGTVKTAGAGKLSEAEKITGKLSNKAIAKKAVTAGLQAMAVATVVGLKVKFSRK